MIILTMGPSALIQLMRLASKEQPAETEPPVTD